MSVKFHLLTTLSCFLALFLFGCLDSFVNPEATIDRGEAMELPDYTGPRAKVAVSDFEWKVDSTGSKTEIDINGKKTEITQSQRNGYSQGLRDMLTTAMVQSKRYRVLERQNFDSLQQEMELSEAAYTDASGIHKGGVKGADLLIMGAITGWEPGTSATCAGTDGDGLLGTASTVFGAVNGAYSKSSMAMDIRIVDAETSEVLAATRVEGIAKDINLGGLLGIKGGSGALSGELGTYAKTPMEKAIRTCLYNAVKFIAENTPRDYMRY